MDVAQDTGNEQRARWNGPAGRAWVDAQEMVDRTFRAMEDVLAGAVRVGSDRTVLDVGCGTGATTIDAARRLGAHGGAVGIDISEPMIAAARDRAKRERSAATFICAGAQAHAFAPASVDTIVSRFGVMFFGDPVAAFANLRRASRRSGQMRFLAWRSAADNPFMTTAERAAAPLLPNLPPRPPDGPGQFAFARRERIHGILQKSGWVEIDIQPFNLDCTMAETDLVSYFSRFGPVGLALQEADERTRAHVIETVRPAFESYVHEANVSFTAACWNVGARAAGRG